MARKSRYQEPADTLNRTLTLAAIYAEGVAAHEQGIRREKNPYRGHEEGSNAWLAGWDSRAASAAFDRLREPWKQGRAGAAKRNPG